MHRRSFMIAGATAAATATPIGGSAVAALGRDLLGAGPAVAQGGGGESALARRLARKGAAGRPVELTGWASPAAQGPGHYVVFCAERPLADPSVADARAWPQAAVRVYPTGGPAPTGRVKVKGTLYTGGFHDAPTGTGARRVLVGAVEAA